WFTPLVSRRIAREPCIRMLRVRNTHVPAATAAGHNPTQQRAAALRHSAAVFVAVLAQTRSIGLILFPGNVRRQLIAPQDVPLMDRCPRTARTATAWNAFAWIGHTASVHVCPRIDRMVQHAQKRRPVRPSPYKPITLDTTMGPKSDQDPM